MQHAVDVVPFRLKESAFQEQVRRATYRFISAAEGSSVELRTLPERLGIAQDAAAAAIEALVNRWELELKNTPQGLVAFCPEVA